MNPSTKIIEVVLQVEVHMFLKAMHEGEGVK